MAELLGTVFVVVIAAGFGLLLFFAVFGRFLDRRRAQREKRRMEEMLREDAPWARPRPLQNRFSGSNNVWRALVERLDALPPDHYDAIDASKSFTPGCEPKVFADRHTGQIWVRYYADNGQDGHAYGYWQELIPFPFVEDPPASVLQDGLPRHGGNHP